MTSRSLIGPLVFASLTILLAVAAAGEIAVEWAQPAYIMPWWIVAIGLAAALAAVAGSVMAARRHRLKPWIAPALTAIIVLAELELIILLPLLLIVLVALAVRAWRRTTGRAPLSDAIGAPGFLLSAGLVPLMLLLLLGGPVAECFAGGEGSSAPVWTWGDNIGSGSSGGGGC